MKNKFRDTSHIRSTETGLDDGLLVTCNCGLNCTGKGCTEQAQKIAYPKIKDHRGSENAKGKQGSPD